MLQSIRLRLPAIILVLVLSPAANALDIIVSNDDGFESALRRRAQIS